MWVCMCVLKLYNHFRQHTQIMFTDRAHITHASLRVKNFSGQWPFCMNCCLGFYCDRIVLLRETNSRCYRVRILLRNWAENFNFFVSSVSIIRPSPHTYHSNAKGLKWISLRLSSPAIPSAASEHTVYKPQFQIFLKCNNSVFSLNDLNVCWKYKQIYRVMPAVNSKKVGQK